MSQTESEATPGPSLGNFFFPLRILYWMSLLFSNTYSKYLLKILYAVLELLSVEMLAQYMLASHSWKTSMIFSHFKKLWSFLFLYLWERMTFFLILPFTRKHFIVDVLCKNMTLMPNYASYHFETALYMMQR